MCGKWFWLATYAVVAAAAAAQQEVRDFGGFFLYFKAKGAEPKHYLNVSKSIIWLWLFGAVAAAAALIVFVVCYKRDSRFWFDNDVYQALYFLAHPPPPSTHTHTLIFIYLYSHASLFSQRCTAAWIYMYTNVCTCVLRMNVIFFILGEHLSLSLTMYADTSILVT